MRFRRTASIGLPLAFLVVPLLLLLSACVGSAPQSTVSPASDNAWLVQGLYKLIFWAAVGQQL